MIYDVAILGGGPAGVAAGVYVARKQMRGVVVTKDFGGQSKMSLDIQNWIGTINISGMELAKSLQQHLEFYAKDVVDIADGEIAAEIKKDGEIFKIETESNKNINARTILIATGSKRKKLAVPRAEEFEGRGIVYCASCDAPMFKNKNVVVAGGGNSGLETVSQLIEYADTITLLVRSDKLTADPVIINKVKQNNKVTIITDTEIDAIRGDKFVNAIVYKNIKTNEKKEIAVEGIFVEIGQIPNTNFVKNILDCNSYGHIKVNPRTQQTNIDGIWAAGDCTDVLYHQNNIAAGDAIKAVENMFLYVKKK